MEGARSIGGPRQHLREEEVASFVSDELGALPLDGRSVCVLVPDGTRTCPLPLLLGAVHGALHGRVARLTVLVALGTHRPMGAGALAHHLGGRVGRGADGRGADGGAAGYPTTTVLEHEWWDPSTFAELGTIGAARMAELSGGRLRREIPVRVNRAVVEHDVTLIVGPVLPHEVVGFSGGNKYLFPGVSGPELIDVTHWLGALITSPRIIGTLGITPVRAVIDEAAAMVPGDRVALCVVTGEGGVTLRAATFGSPEAAWRSAAEVAAACHVRRLERPVRRVLSVLPAKYEDLWTGAKGFYKVEPVVADRGQVVLYAPHITELSRTHPAIAEIGYHCRDYFLAQWDRFEHYHWGDLAHSTHLRGAGTYDPATGETFRVTVTLATGIPEDAVRAVGLDYLDPAQVDVDRWRADPGTLVVDDAGENLYRLAGEDTSARGAPGATGGVRRAGG